jgi:hypothetical protein
MTHILIRFLKNFMLVLFITAWTITMMSLLMGSIMPPPIEHYDPIRDWERHHFVLCLVLGAIMFITSFASIPIFIDFIFRESIE